MAVTVVLYLCNRFLLLPATGGALHRFLAFYCSDILAGALLLAVVNQLLLWGRLRPLASFLRVTLFVLLCGLFLELAPLLYRPEAVCDFRDLLAYLAGGWLALFLARLFHVYER